MVAFLAAVDICSYAGNSTPTRGARTTPCLGIFIDPTLKIFRRLKIAKKFRRQFVCLIVALAVCTLALAAGHVPVGDMQTALLSRRHRGVVRVKAARCTSLPDLTSGARETNA
jgi:hypothetical protein